MKVKVYVIYDDDGEIMAVMDNQESADIDCMETGASHKEVTLYVEDAQSFMESFEV